MSNNKSLVATLSMVCLIATIFAVIGLLGKGRAAAPVTVNFLQDTLSVDFIKNNENLWDNYPDLIIMSRMEKVSNGTLSEIGINDTIIRGKKEIVFFRCHFGANLQDSLLAQQLLKFINPAQHNVIALLDKYSYQYLKKIGLLDRWLPFSVVLTRDIPIKIERFQLSYFFQLDENNKVKDLYFPKAEIPAVTSIYFSNGN